MRHPSSTIRQGGAALVIALIVLLVLTVMGISGIRQATLEESMAFNSQTKSITFQAAETAIGGVVINQSAVLDGLRGTGIGSIANNDYSAMVNPPGEQQTVTAQVATAYTGEGLAAGSSVKSMGRHFFSITGTGEITAASARSIHRFGGYRDMPK